MMRQNEYHRLQEFIEEYDGKEYKAHQSFSGSEFTYHGVYYRMCREPERESLWPNFSDGTKGRSRVVLVHWKDGWFSDFTYELIGWYRDLDDLLDNCWITGKTFREVIMADETKIIGKD